jgi:hypothetical protein
MGQSIYHGVDDWALAALHLEDPGRMYTGQLPQFPEGQVRSYTSNL